ncbi:MAG TPA: hypothetical protein VGR57_05280 [Ktedonobacterales bacterium]|nr:hypothetical protein [Ktedonobacterales bacterium]
MFEQAVSMVAAKVRQEQRTRLGERALALLLGLLVVGGSSWLEPLRAHGWQAFGPMLGIMLVVFSLFGDLPPSISWLQRLGGWLFAGIALGTVLLLLPLVVPGVGRDTSLVAFSPSVWAAYISIVLVGLSFENSRLPQVIYRVCSQLPVGPTVVIPGYIVIMGLLGNVLDGVSIMAISVATFLSLLPLRWALRASFALLFGGLISNLVTVAAEPTNIKFQDVLQSLLDKVSPPYWFTNWPISVVGILVPALWLAVVMRREGVAWRADETPPTIVEGAPNSRASSERVLSVLALTLLAAGIITHSILLARGSSSRHGADAPLWLFVLPAGVVAVAHLLSIERGPAAWTYVRNEWPVWGKLMIIFSLLWFLGNGLIGAQSVFAGFFLWPAQVRYGIMVLLSLASSITDNVALAAMQGAILVHHPLPIWQIRLLFILLTWAGGFTPFGCLQSLTTNSRLKLSTGAWFRETLPWGAAAILGGLAGLALIALLYPHAVGLVR